MPVFVMALPMGIYIDSSPFNDDCTLVVRLFGGPC